MSGESLFQKRKKRILLSQ